MSVRTEGGPIERAALAAVLDLRRTGENVYTADPVDGSSRNRIYGGQLVGQALAAAGLTVPEGRAPHSIHGHFLHAGDSDEPIEYEVVPLRDGRAQNIRQVVGRQGQHDLFALTASFAGVSTSGSVFEHQVPTTPLLDFAAVPTLEQTLALVGADFRDWFIQRLLPKPVDIRFVDRPSSDYVLQGEVPPLQQRVLLRANGTLPDDASAQAAGLAYLSDMFLLSAAVHRHTALIGSSGLRAVSLDHAIWLHGPVRSDEWLLYVMESDWAGQGRGLCRGHMFDATGRLVATIAQEGLVKPS
jgi:acyl-CoA thioesterase-2